MTRVGSPPTASRAPSRPPLPRARSPRALAEGWASVEPSAEFVYRPMADGGEGTVAAFAAAVSGSALQPITVTGPAGLPVETAWLILPDGTAVVDLASTSGVELLDELWPRDADSTGLGQTIAAALGQGAKRIVVDIRSSASTDGRTCMLTALGARLLDAEGAPIRSGARGLIDIAAADLSALRPPGEVRVNSSG